MPQSKTSSVLFQNEIGKTDAPNGAQCRAPVKNRDANKLNPEDRAAHDWYRFVLSYPPHLVRDYLEKFAVKKQHRVLDPLCGTGTTVAECKKLEDIVTLGRGPWPPRLPRGIGEANDERL